MACNREECGCVCSVTGLAHIGVFVKDLKRSVDFYTGILGFECYSEAEIPGDNGNVKIAFVRCGTCDIELVQLPEYSERPVGTIDHIAMSVSDLDAMIKCLERKGIVFDTQEPVVLPNVLGGFRYIFFSGPDGERLELSQHL